MGGRDRQGARRSRAAYAVVIGGPDGLDPALRAQARTILGFGAMTWPHQLVR